MLAGKLRKGRRTKDLIPHLKRGNIVLISHEDLDLVAAEGLGNKGVVAVLNTRLFTSGRYPNLGPEHLLARGIRLYGGLEETLWDIPDGTRVVIADDILKAGEDYYSLGKPLTREGQDLMLAKTKANLLGELDLFIENTLAYAKKEKDLVVGEVSLPPLETSLWGKPVVVVVRGRDYRQDLQAINNYIKESSPILLAVDGGADALLEAGLKPHIILGDMDSVSDKALKSGCELVVHSYTDGRAPGMERIKALGFEARSFPIAGTSEDAAMLLAHGKGADLIVAVGTHSSMIDFLEKGRPGMASTFLTRLKVGDKLVDARGLSRLYQTRGDSAWLLAMVAAGLVPLLAWIYSSQSFRHLLYLILFKLTNLRGGGM